MGMTLLPININDMDYKGYFQVQYVLPRLVIKATAKSVQVRLWHSTFALATGPLCLPFSIEGTLRFHNTIFLPPLIASLLAKYVWSADYYKIRSSGEV